MSMRTKYFKWQWKSTGKKMGQDWAERRMAFHIKKQLIFVQAKQGIGQIQDGKVWI